MHGSARRSWRWQIEALIRALYSLRLEGRLRLDALIKVLTGLSIYKVVGSAQVSVVLAAQEHVVNVQSDVVVKFVVPYRRVTERSISGASHPRD